MFPLVAVNDNSVFNNTSTSNSIWYIVSTKIYLTDSINNIQVYQVNSTTFKMVCMSLYVCTCVCVHVHVYVSKIT